MRPDWPPSPSWARSPPRWARSPGVRRIASVVVTVNATPDFTQHTVVADGASDLLVEVFAERGRHARLAVGVASLPADLVLELTAVVEVEP